MIVVKKTNLFDRSYRGSRRGLSLIELLSAMLVMSMVIGTLAAMSNAVHVSTEYSRGHTTAAQHARVAIERIQRAVRTAYATADYPGVGVIEDAVGVWGFPDTAVIWRPRVTPTTPAAKPFHADGPPRMNELVIFCPDPGEPHKLIELTAADGDTRELNMATLVTDVEALKISNTSKKVVLTDLLRTASVGSDPSTNLRGAVRFNLRISPSATAWADYKAGTTAWQDLPWVQGVHGSKTGLRQTWLRFELQLVPGEATVSDAGALRTTPYFGSAALYYELNQ